MATIRLGMLTPALNMVLEPATAAMLAGLPRVSARFARIRGSPKGGGGVPEDRGCQFCML